MKDYRNLKVWEKGHQVVLDVYKITLRFPKDELYGLTNQIRRAAASIPANIAEGCGRGSNTDFNHFLKIAMGSASELDYHLFLANDLGFMDKSNYTELAAKVDEIKRMLASLISKIKAEC
jgi:four helix bundle protein